MGHARTKAAPSVYGRYETLFRIAAGGMAEVYAARVRGEAGFQKLVALKRMLPHLTDDERFVTMFMDEGKLAANISSPNVVSTLDLGRADDGSLYLVMELVVGTTLSTLLRNAAKADDQLPVGVAVEMLAQAAQGLHDAHEARTPFGAPLQLVHRDVSPQNILIGSDGRVRITDFGVARAVLRRTKTSTGEFKGKLSYFSPEQCADKTLDRRSDLFSLGVVAWETFTTRRLFHAENPLAVLERVTRMPIPSANAVRPDVPPAVAAVVAKALERDRDARYDSVAEFAQALRAAARDAEGVGDRHRVAELVKKFGGDSLARVQDQLKRSLSTPGGLPDDEPFDDGKTEISSGIIFRPEDGAPIPATPQAPAGASAPATFGELLSPSSVSASITGSQAAMIPAQPAQPAQQSKLPLIIASIVAIVGLGAGVGIGLMATVSDAPDAASEDVRILPPAGGPSADVTPTDPVVPEAELAQPAVPSEPEQTADEPATGRRVGRRPLRRGSASPAPTPPELAQHEPTGEVTAPTPPVAEATPEPPARAVHDPHRARVRSGVTRPIPPPEPAEPRPGGGMMTRDDFNSYRH
jgi:serine/threonine-protein kinase